MYFYKIIPVTEWLKVVKYGMILTLHGVGEDAGHAHGSLPASWFL